MGQTKIPSIFIAEPLNVNCKNRIANICNANGQWCSNSKVSENLVAYFQGLFTDNPRQPGETLITIQTMISEDMNRQLSAGFMESEVQATIKQMAPLKAPDLNGMPPSSIIIISNLQTMMLLNLFLVSLILLLSLIILTMLISLSSRKSSTQNLSLNFSLLAYIMSFIKYFQRFWLIDLKRSYLRLLQSIRVLLPRVVSCQITFQLLLRPSSICKIQLE